MSVPQPIAEAFAAALSDLARGWRDAVNQRLKPLDLNHSSAIALRRIAAHAEGLTQIDLAREIGVEGPTVLRLIDRLEQRGWVERRSVPGDRRLKRVRVTDAAGPVLARLDIILGEVRGRMLDGSDPEEIERLTALLRRLNDGFGD